MNDSPPKLRVMYFIFYDEKFIKVKTKLPKRAVPFGNLPHLLLEPVGTFHIILQFHILQNNHLDIILYISLALSL